MSETRQVWKPSRAKTRTAASRMILRLSTACLLATLRRYLAGPPVRLGAAVGQGRQGAADLLLALEVELGEGEGLRVRRGREDDAPRVDDHRAPAGADAGGVLADLVGGDDERLPLDRPRAQQDLPVIARGREGERGRHGDDLRALDGEDPVELGEADVVTDREAEARVVGRARDDDLVPGRL